MTTARIIPSALDASPPQQEGSILPPWRDPEYREDPEDVLPAALDKLHALASCVAVLGEAERSSALGFQLADDALPMLGIVMMDIAADAIRAADALHRRTRDQLAGGLQ